MSDDDCMACNAQAQAPKSATIGSAFARGFAAAGFAAVSGTEGAFRILVGAMCERHRRDVNAVISEFAKANGTDLVTVAERLGAFRVKVDA